MTLRGDVGDPKLFETVRPFPGIPPDRHRELPRLAYIPTRPVAPRRSRPESYAQGSLRFLERQRRCPELYFNDNPPPKKAWRLLPVTLAFLNG